MLLLKYLNSQFLVAVDHIQLRTMKSKTVDPIDLPLSVTCTVILHMRCKIREPFSTTQHIYLRDVYVCVGALIEMKNVYIGAFKGLYGWFL